MNEADLDWLKWNAEGGAAGFTPRANRVLAELKLRGSAIERVRELHRQSPDGTCVECYGLAENFLQWPCPTLQVLDWNQQMTEQPCLLAIVEPGAVTHDGRQTWSARCEHCQTRIGGVTRERAETWKHGHDVAAERHGDQP